MPTLRSAQTVFLDVFSDWRCKNASMPSFCVSFSSEAVTGPHCSINDCTDKRAAPFGVLVYNPFPKYLPSRAWCIFFLCNVYLTQAGSGRKAMLGTGSLWGLVWFVSLAFICFMSFVLLHKKKKTSGVFWRDLYLGIKVCTDNFFFSEVPLTKPVITSWMPDQINSSWTVSLCNCLTQLTRRCSLSFVRTADLCKQSLSVLRLGMRMVIKLCLQVWMNLLAWQRSTPTVIVLLQIGSKWLSLKRFHQDDWIPQSSLLYFKHNCLSKNGSIKW